MSGRGEHPGLKGPGSYLKWEFPSRVRKRNKKDLSLAMGSQQKVEPRHRREKEKGKLKDVEKKPCNQILNVEKALAPGNGGDQID